MSLSRITNHSYMTVVVQVNIFMQENRESRLPALDKL